MKSAMTTLLELELATTADADNLNLLINQAYRGQEGWTRETNIVSGKRSSIEAVRDIIHNPSSHMLMAKINGTIVACVCVEETENQTYIGTFAVNPAFQNQGIGKQVLNLAESYAVNRLGSKKLRMVVISQREELIAFYERRGYRRTGEISKYPVHLNVGIPTVKGLTIECLEKIT